MSLKYIVPTLGLVAASTTPLMAADVGGISIGGYVDSILEISSLDEDIARTNPNGTSATDKDDFIIDFSAAAELEIGYQIGDKVKANAEIFFSRSLDRSTGATSGTNVDLEQAYVDWQASEKVNLRMGRFHNHLGWEGTDAPELYRINQSIVYNAFTGADTEGLAVGIAASDDISIGIYITDGFYDAAEDGEEDRKELGDLAVAADIEVKVNGVGNFGGSLTYDINNSISDTNEEADTFAINLLGTIDAMQESSGLLFGFDFHYKDDDWKAGYGLMGLANWEFKTEMPCSFTLMLSYVEPNDTSNGDTVPTGKTVGEADEELELALALLTNPTNDKNFAANVELRYISRGDLDMDQDRNEIGIFVEALAVIP